MGGTDSMTRGGTTALFGMVPTSPMRVLCGAAVGAGAADAGASFVATTETGGSGTAAVTRMAAIDTVTRPVKAQSAAVVNVDSVRRRARESRIARSRVSSCDGWAIDTAAKDAE